MLSLIINKFCLQIYNGLDIATNKATKMERAQVPHHLLDVVSPFKQFTVVDFQQLALKTIEDIHSRNKVPIIVGGTNYYIESILWDTLVSTEPPDTSLEPGNVPPVPENGINTLEELLSQPIEARDLRHVPMESLHRFLAELDPVASKRVHLTDRRKVIRALQYYQQTGQKYSERLEEQRTQGSRHGGPLRYRDALILWVDCEKDVLNERLDARVDEMMALGLIDELEQFHKDYHQLRLADGQPADYTEGIFQAIGFKEFHEYLLLTPEERKTYDGSLVLGRAIILLKQRTRSYVTKQLKWINRRFLVDGNIRLVPNVYRLDTTQPEQWAEHVNAQANLVIDLALQAQYELTDPEKIESINADKLGSLRVQPKVTSLEEDRFVAGQFWCATCQVHISGGKSYQLHLASKRHRALKQN